MKKQNTQGHPQNHFKVVANIGKTVLNDIGWRKNKKKGNKKSPFGIKSYFPDPIPGNDCEKIPGKGGQFKGKPVFTENQKEGNRPDRGHQRTDPIHVDGVIQKWKSQTMDDLLHNGAPADLHQNAIQRRQKKRRPQKTLKKQ